MRLKGFQGVIRVTVTDMPHMMVEEEGSQGFRGVIGVIEMPLGNGGLYRSYRELQS